LNVLKTIAEKPQLSLKTPTTTPDIEKVMCQVIDGDPSRDSRDRFRLHVPKPSQMVQIP